MGHSSQKKKRGGRKGKGKQPPKDRFAQDGQELLSEELTALTAIFQEDFKILSQPPQPHFFINLRPRSDVRGYENHDVSAILSVRCLLGYPYKCPKLQIVPEKGLNQENINCLLSLLLDEASSNAREGRVMIFNLVEAAQEFLSEVLSLQEPNKSAPTSTSSEKDELLHGDVQITSSESGHSEEPFVFRVYDLFSDLCGDNGSWPQHISTVAKDDYNNISESNVAANSNDQQKVVAVQNLNNFSVEHGAVGLHQYRNSLSTTLYARNEAQKPSLSVKLNVVEEDTGEDGESASSKDFISDQRTGVENDGLEGQTSVLLPTQEDECHDEKKDIFMAYLLRLACSSEGSLALAFPDITSELYNLGMLSERARDLAAEQPLNFNKIFNSAFQQQLVSSQFSEFWKASTHFSKDSASISNSRYLSDFEEIRSLGHGGFGHVVLCKNKLDGRQYAVKKIRLKSKSSPFNEKILREVATLARLQHQHVVRYYQAWFETEFHYHSGDITVTSVTAETSDSYIGSCSIDATRSQTWQDSTYLYIQMEYCPRTLRQDFENFDRFVDKDLTWHLFRQIVEGLVHIHSQGIIHRDLTPNNIFFDARNDIKIGDFGLAKFLKLEQLDQDHLNPAESTGNSVDGTGQVGTYFYTAPEIDHGWPQINEKVDMYSLGVVFFELWHPFGTAMERYSILSELKSEGSLPLTWVAEFPEQSSLVRRLMSPIPSDRPSATELLQNALPPRMEDEWLNALLRTIQTSEDTYVYDRVISTIFDEDRITMVAQRQHGEQAKITQNGSSFLQCTEFDPAFRDSLMEAAKEVFKKHGARRFEIAPINLSNCHHWSKRKTLHLLTSNGSTLELCHELRSPFISWLTSEQILSFKRYEISWVYRRGIGHSTPNRFLQGDFDIIGGTTAVTVAEVIKVALDLAGRFFHSDHLEIRLNHAQILSAIWSWIGIEGVLCQDVVNVLSSLSLYSPQSAKRKSQWALIRRQLLQGLYLAKSVVDRLQAVDLRFCGFVDLSLARLRGALSPDNLTRKALDEISVLVNYLRVWKIYENVSLDVLMPPEESYYRGIHFQIFVITEGNFGTMPERNLLAIGGCYDHILHAMWDHKSNPPSAAGLSIGLEKFLHHRSADTKHSSLCKIESNTSVLVCSRGGGGLLEERMELAAELWEANIKADFVPLSVCSLREHYDYANEHDIKLLVIITEAGLSQTGLVEVRSLELRKERKLERGELVKFLNDVASTQFRSISIWNQ